MENANVIQSNECNRGEPREAPYRGGRDAVRFAKKKTLVVCAAALLGSSASANAAVIARFNFEVNTPADANNVAANGPHNADEGLGQASGVHTRVETDWSTPVGNGSANSYSSNEWSIGDYYQFMTSTVGASGITLLFDQTRSTTGPTDFKVQYSTDGNTFLDVPNGAYSLGQINFSSQVEVPTTPPRFGFDMSSIAALNNQPSVFLRLVATAAPSATGGTSRVDNVIIGTDPVPEPAALTLFALAGVALGPRRRRI